MDEIVAEVKNGAIFLLLSLNERIDFSAIAPLISEAAVPLLVCEEEYKLFTQRKQRKLECLEQAKGAVTWISQPGIQPQIQEANYLKYLYSSGSWPTLQKFMTQD